MCEHICGCVTHSVVKSTYKSDLVSVSQCYFGIIIIIIIVIFMYVYSVQHFSDDQNQFFILFLISKIKIKMGYFGSGAAWNLQSNW